MRSSHTLPGDRVLAPALVEDLKKNGVDIGLALDILDSINLSEGKGSAMFKASGVPRIDGARVVDLRADNLGNGKFPCDSRRYFRILDDLGWGAERIGAPHLPKKDKVVLSAEDLETLGLALSPRCAYGVLNGGSATSYSDPKKNAVFGEAVFGLLKKDFESLAQSCGAMPKGATPAYINPDGSRGATFLELKMRARLLLVEEAKRRGFMAEKSLNPLPLYQMTSEATEESLARFYADAGRGPFLKILQEKLGISSSAWTGAVQPMICAFTHSSEGFPKRIFDEAYGGKDRCIPLPGGHGQCFRVLSQTFRDLLSQGVRYAYLGNVDNIGYVPDPKELALFALSGEPAAFEFAPRSPMDVKGGILALSAQGRMAVVDIGPAIGIEDVKELERQGSTILFNCATGIFDLEYLVPRLDSISRELPLRVSDQDKAPGLYSQAEQITWEVTEILPSFLAFAVDKRKRFLAAKLLADTLLTSGVGISSDAMPQGLRETAMAMHAGLNDLLSGTFALKRSNGRWQAMEA